ncbi:MAG: phage tail tape measure protein [Pseudodesulfovibrio sp.]|nr:phage tail tape measure protein [Pseudodesulfovibrio sp.]
MSTKLEKLTFAINLLDRVSAPVRRIQKTLGGMASSSQAAFGQIGTGAMGVGAAGYSLYRFINPAEQMQRALGEVASLDVGENALKGLSNEALAYSVKYGRAAEGFVRSAYDIQSSIEGLKGNDLAVFTNAGNVLASATKSDAGTITDYMGTMHGIFKQQAAAMGKGNWIELLAGQTATAVQMFKTDGSKWAAGWTALGANATAAGIKMTEQMAVLGRLQATMSGSEAGTKYKAFLAGAGKAQDKLGLSFVDSEGNLLGMLDILGKLQGKFGDTLSLAESDALKDAFGSDEAVSLIKLLMADTDGLTESMDKLGKVTGMEKAEEMASKMVTPLMRIGEGVTALATGLGFALMPALNPVIDGMADGAAAMTRWTTEFPNITRWIGYGILSVIGLTAALGGLAMIAGIVRIATIGWGMATLFAKGVSAAFSVTLGIFKAVMWAVNAAMLANPIGLIIAGIVLLIAGVAAVIYWWDDLKAAFMDTSWGQAIMGVIDGLLGYLEALINPIGWVMDNIGGIMAYVGLESSSGPPATSPSLEAPRRSTVQPGGVTNHIAKTFASHQSNQKTVGQQNIHFHDQTDSQTIKELISLET